MAVPARLFEMDEEATAYPELENQLLKVARDEACVSCRQAMSAFKHLNQ